MLASLIDLVLHLDVHLMTLVANYGVWVYGILFLIIYAETGLVFAPFLPGDSLLFVAGTLCGLDVLQLPVLMPALMLAAFSGDNTNYWAGRLIGMRLFYRFEGKVLKREYLTTTQRFYEKHGVKTIVIARFMPIVRTLAPFVAGIGLMRYRLFVLYSAAGSIAWIGSLTLAGYFFGNIPVVKNNLTLIILAVIFLSFMPALLHFIKHRLSPAGEGG
jgi:membrane-associated protein